ncbi:MAG: hypothetical protein RIR41_241 [Pseudomonadota bacterium]
MFGRLASGLAALGMAMLGIAGCAYRSDIDLAPLADRPSRPVVAPGDYCEATASSPPYTVKSAEGCERIGWDAASRTHVMKIDEEGEEPTRFAPVSMGEDLILLQADGGEGSQDGRYHVTLVLAKDAAFFLLPPLERKKFAALAAKHPGVTLRDVPEKDPVITAGDPAAIKAFLKAAAREALRGANLEDDELAIAIRDRSGVPDHEANGMQTMNIIELVTAIFALQGED